MKAGFYINVQISLHFCVRSVWLFCAASEHLVAVFTPVQMERTNGEAAPESVLTSQMGPGLKVPEVTQK